VGQSLSTLPGATTSGKFQLDELIAVRQLIDVIFAPDAGDDVAKGAECAPFDSPRSGGVMERMSSS
jgi:hypothetical protein